MADWTKPIPGPAVEGEDGHPEDHNAIYEVLREVQGNVDAAEGKAAWGGVTGKPSTYTPATHSHAYADITGKPETFPPADHTHAAGDITGTLAAARIPSLAQSKITGLEAKITEIEGRIAALETPEA